MQGYGTMAMEAGEQLKEYGCEPPDPTSLSRQALVRWQALW